jgi:hypothetical protein
VTSDDVFILDDGYEVMVWVGKGASVTERKEALNFAQKYLNDYNLPKDKVITRMMDGGENEMFEAAFETGVMSMHRPGDGTKFTGDMDKIRGTHDLCFFFFFCSSLVFAVGLESLLHLYVVLYALRSCSLWD